MDSIQSTPYNFGVQELLNNSGYDAIMIHGTLAHTVSIPEADSALAALLNHYIKRYSAECLMDDAAYSHQGYLLYRIALEGRIENIIFPLVKPQCDRKSAQGPQDRIGCGCFNLNAWEMLFEKFRSIIPRFLFLIFNMEMQLVQGILSHIMIVLGSLR